MRIVFSERVKELLKMVKPYIDPDTSELNPDAPDEIKRAHKEFKELADKEYEAACLD